MTESGQEDESMLLTAWRDTAGMGLLGILRSSAPATDSAGFCDGNQSEPAGSGFRVQTRQFPFAASSLELRRPSVHPDFAFRKQAVDQHCNIAGHRFDRSLE